MVMGGLLLKGRPPSDDKRQSTACESCGRRRPCWAATAAKKATTAAWAGNGGGGPSAGHDFVFFLLLGFNFLGGRQRRVARSTVPPSSPNFPSRHSQHEKISLFSISVFSPSLF